MCDKKLRKNLQSDCFCGFAVSSLCDKSQKGGSGKNESHLVVQWVAVRMYVRGFELGNIKILQSDK